MLAGAAATEVIACQQNLCSRRLRLVQNEVRKLLSFSIIAPIIKEVSIQAFLADGLEEPRRNNLVRIDIVYREWQQTAFEFRDLLHGLSPSSAACERPSLCR